MALSVSPEFRENPTDDNVHGVGVVLLHVDTLALLVFFLLGIDGELFDFGVAEVLEVGQIPEKVKILVVFFEEQLSHLHLKYISSQDEEGTVFQADVVIGRAEFSNKIVLEEMSSLLKNSDDIPVRLLLLCYIIHLDLTVQYENKIIRLLSFRGN